MKHEYLSVAIITTGSDVYSSLTVSADMAQTTGNIGYGLLSSLISSDADLSAFRGFKALNIRNILYLQSELAEVEQELQELDEEYNDRAKGNDIWSVPRSWRAVKKEDGDYFETVSRLRKTSEEYCVWSEACRFKAAD